MSVQTKENSFDVSYERWKWKIYVFQKTTIGYQNFISGWHFSTSYPGLLELSENILSSPDKLLPLWKVCKFNLKGHNYVSIVYGPEKLQPYRFTKSMRNNCLALQMSFKYYFSDLNVRQYKWVWNIFTSIIQINGCEV